MQDAHLQRRAVSGRAIIYVINHISWSLFADVSLKVINHNISMAVRCGCQREYGSKGIHITGINKYHDLSVFKIRSWLLKAYYKFKINALVITKYKLSGRLDRVSYEVVQQ